MHRPRVFRGIGFRLALVTAMLVMAALIVHGAAVYGFVSTTMQLRLRGDIRAEMATLRAEAADHSQDLTGIVERHLRGHGPRQFVYALWTAGQVRLAGDAWLRPARPGWARIDGTDREGRAVAGGDLLVLTQQVGPDRLLSVGHDIRWIADVQEDLFEILIWTLLGGISLAGAAALVVNRVIARRIAAVTATAGAIMRGDLSQRVPVTGSGDEFDHLSLTLNKMLGRVEQLMDSLEQVSTDIAHDLRTPLARLRQRLERARETAGPPEISASVIDHALAEIDGMLTTFTALLRIAHMESGTSRPAFRPVDLTELVQSVAEAYEPNAVATGHRIEVDLASSLRIYGDRDLLAQAIVNVLENALAHTPAGTCIRIRLARVGDTIRLSFSDDGPGVPATELERIFRRFYRLETSRTTPGTGLGLSLVAAVARAHGAGIAARDNHPGLRIEIDFPGQQPP